MNTIIDYGTGNIRALELIKKEGVNIRWEYVGRVDASFNWNEENNDK